MYLTSRRRPNPKYLLSRPQVTSGEHQSLLSPYAGGDSTAPCLASPPDRTRGSQQESRLGIHEQGIQPMRMGSHIICPLPPHRSFMGVRPGYGQGTARVRHRTCELLWFWPWYLIVLGVCVVGGQVHVQRLVGTAECRLSVRHSPGSNPCRSSKEDKEEQGNGVLHPSASGEEPIS